MTETRPLLEPNLLTGTALRDLVRRRLHGQPAGGPALDPRGDIRPYQWLLDSYVDALPGGQQRLSQAFADLLAESESWPEAAQVELLDLLQQAGDDAVAPAIWGALRQFPQKLDAEAVTRAARLLKVLLARGHRGSPEFWLDWLDRLGPDYGALVLSGLMEHGADQVAAHLPRLVASPKALRAVLRFLPTLEDRWGQETLLNVLRTGLPRCPSAVAGHLYERYPELTSAHAKAAPALEVLDRPELAPYRDSLWTQSAEKTCFRTDRGWSVHSFSSVALTMIGMVVQPQPNPHPALH